MCPLLQMVAGAVLIALTGKGAPHVLAATEPQEMGLAQIQAPALRIAVEVAQTVEVVVNLKSMTVFNSHRLLLVLGAIFLTVFSVAALFFWFDSEKRTIKDGTVILEQAESFFRNGDYTSAMRDFVRALENNSFSEQEGYIKYRIAMTEAASGNHVQAIRHYKEIAATSAYLPLVRAYAIEGMQDVAAVSSDPEINREIFSDEPYVNFLGPIKSIAVGHRELAKYASGFFPIAPAELRIAYWYAYDLFGMKTGLASSTPKKITNARNQIKEHLVAAEKDMLRISADPSLVSTLPSLYSLQASIASFLHFSKEPPLAGDPISLFEKALHAGGSLMEGASYGTAQKEFITYYFAAFLGEAYPQQHIQKIRELLSTFYKDGATVNPHIAAFFKDHAKSNTIHQRNLTRLASVDSEFKSLLEQLGWNFPAL